MFIQQIKNYLYPIAALILSGIFFFSATAKLFYWRDTVYAMDGLILNESLAVFITAFIVTLEILLAFSLLQIKYWKFGGMVSIAVLVLFTAIVFWGKWQGLITECPCFGKLFGAKIGWALIARNSVLFFCGLLLITQKQIVNDVSSKITFYANAVNKMNFFLLLINFLFLSRLIGNYIH
jgi:hypothetical protein